jgi:hypothetical protein
LDATFTVTVIGGHPEPGFGAAGSVSGGGWYAAGAPVSVQATPVAGFQYLGTTGALTGSANPFVFNAGSPETLVANFGPSGAPQISVTRTPPLRPPRHPRSTCLSR